MISAKGLMKVIEEIEKIEIANREEVYSQLESAIKDKRIYIFKNEEKKEIGFVTWQERYASGNLYIFVNNLVIMKEYKGQANLLKFRTLLKEKYPTLFRLYWKNRKHKRFVYN